MAVKAINHLISNLIEAAQAYGNGWDTDDGIWQGTCQGDLETEWTRMTQEIERLTAEVKDMTEQRDAAWAEIRRLRGELMEAQR